MYNQVFLSLIKYEGDILGREFNTPIKYKYNCLIKVKVIIIWIM